jgi:AcrR family transcriptional regulator
MKEAGKKELDRGTEEKILNTAREVFLVRGKSAARMEEIAREAGVNKALLHYYYRSKDNIFRAVFTQVARELLKSILQKVDFDKPLEELLRDFVTNHINVIRKGRKIFQFFFSELWMNRDEVLPLFREVLQGEEIPVYVRFFERIDQGVRKGEIRPVDPFHLLMNILSLDVFYFIAAPLFYSMSGFPTEKQKELEEARADEVFRFVWESIRPRKEDGNP